MVATAAFFALDDLDDRILVDVIDRLAARDRSPQGQRALLELQLLPALQTTMALGVGAVAAGRIRPFARCLAEVSVPDNSRIDAMAPGLLRGVFVDGAQVALGLQRNHTPISDHLFGVTRPAAAVIHLEGQRYEDAFEEVEYLMGLAYADAQGDSELRWAPVGRFGWRRRDDRNRVGRVVDLTGHDLVEAGMFERSADRLRVVRSAYDEVVARTADRWW